MLTAAPVVAFLATADPAAAIAFSRDGLGLRLVEDMAFALVFDAGGTELRIQKVQTLVPAGYTALGWAVDDIARTVGDLAGRGVRVERFDGMGQDADGVWTSPGGARVAWFRDTDGNLLSLTQYP